MSPYIVIAIIATYFAIIFAVSYFSSRKSSTSDFFRGGNSSPWWVVAIGMIGTTLSGVTFISVPGRVAGAAKMTYFEVILGNFLGYILIMHFIGLLCEIRHYDIEQISRSATIGSRYAMHITKPKTIELS